MLLHGCCHNPIGIDPDAAGWTAIAERIAKQKMIPSSISPIRDWAMASTSMRRALARSAAVPEALLAYSCDKNFGLYRERTGALFAIVPDADAGTVVLSNLLALARANWSMPPDHGAAIVRIIWKTKH